MDFQIRAPGIRQEEPEMHADTVRQRLDNCAIASDTMGKLAAYDSKWGNQALILDAGGNVCVRIGLEHPVRSLAFDQKGDLMVFTEFSSHLLHRFTSEGNFIDSGILPYPECPLVWGASNCISDKQLAILPSGVFILRNSILEVVDKFSKNFDLQARYFGDAFLIKPRVTQCASYAGGGEATISVGYPPLDGYVVGLVGTNGGNIALLTLRSLKPGGNVRFGEWCVETMDSSLRLVSVAKVPLQSNLISFAQISSGDWVFGSRMGEIFIVSQEELIPLDIAGFIQETECGLLRSRDNVLGSQRITPPYFSEKAMSTLNSMLKDLSPTDFICINGAIDVSGRLIVDKLMGGGSLSKAKRSKLCALHLKPAQKKGISVRCKVTITCFFSGAANFLIREAGKKLVQRRLV